MMRTVGPAVAGSWYPADKDALAGTVDDLLSKASARVDRASPATVAAISPHAGFVYSGEVAAHALGLFRGRRVRRVVLVGPSHYAGFRGACLPDADAYRTPLGDVPIDTEAVEALRGEMAFEVDSRPYSREHSLESEIPFLQRTLEEGWTALPILIGAYSRASDLASVAKAVLPFAGPDTIVVVSSDFTHYGRAFGFTPFDKDVAENVERLDRGAVDRIASGDAEAFEAYCDETGATVCGRLAIGVLLRLWPEGSRGRLVAYDTSGRMTGDWSHTVSYAAIAVARHAA